MTTTAGRAAADRRCAAGQGNRPTPLTAPGLPEGWTNFYRQDDVAAVAYFYLDHPESDLPPLQSEPERTADL